MTSIAATCLTLDKRLDHVENYVVPTIKDLLGLDVRIFLAGEGKLVGRPYDYIDDPHTIPQRYICSTDYPTWYTPQCYNAWKCHRQIFQEFLETDNDFLLLLEDDIKVEEDFMDILGDGGGLREIERALNFDMLYLGSYNSSKYGNLIYPNILSLPRLSGVGGFHAVILRRRVVKRLLELSSFGPYDWMASKFLHGNFNCFAVNPSIITQMDGYSYIEKSNLTKPDRYV